jgi:hypothetical protein
MPTVLRDGPFRLFFYSSDRGEPPHIHVERDENQAKFWLNPVRLDDGGGFRQPELRRIEKLVMENAEQLLRGWHDFFHQND